MCIFLSRWNDVSQQAYQELSGEWHLFNNLDTANHQTKGNLYTHSSSKDHKMKPQSKEAKFMQNVSLESIEQHRNLSGENCEHFTDISALKNFAYAEDACCDQGEVVYQRSGSVNMKAFQNQKLIENPEKILQYGLKGETSISYGYNNDDNDDGGDDGGGGGGADPDGVKKNFGEDGLKGMFQLNPVHTRKSLQFDHPGPMGDIQSIQGQMETSDRCLDQGMDYTNPEIQESNEELEDDLSYRLYIRDNFLERHQSGGCSFGKHGFQEIQLSDTSQEDEKKIETILESGAITKNAVDTAEGVDIQKFMLPEGSVEDIPQQYKIDVGGSNCSKGANGSDESKTSEQRKKVPPNENPSRTDGKLDQCLLDGNVKTMELNGSELMTMTQDDDNLQCSGNVLETRNLPAKQSQDCTESYRPIARNRWPMLKENTESDNRVIYHSADLMNFSNSMEVKQFLNDIVR